MLHFMQNGGGWALTWVLGVSILISACGPDSANAQVVDPVDRRLVEEIVVRYEPSSPLETAQGRPWGAQCVSSRYQAQLKRGRALGARMHVTRIEPGVPARIARAIANEMQQCPYIEWSEADVMRLVVSQ